MKKQDVLKKKNRKKVIKSIFQGIILMILFGIIVKAMFAFKRYEPFDTNSVSGTDNGFIALSYFGVGREGDAELISTKRLEEHLKLLYENGYQTISQQDVEDYYKNGKSLPEKALFLMFEDGRRDTTIFAQEIMEKYNYKATIMSYAEKFEDDEGKFLSIKDLKKLEDTTFWELGVNGYRLSYINAFDRDNNYLGELTSLEYSRVKQYLDKNYNHYLMDYLRDEDGIPKESRSEMIERISSDYRQMENIYTEGIGSLPGVYALMHANTGAFGNNDKVSAVNEEWIKKLFQINYNREGFSLNNRESSIYDLTRMQPQAYWSTNHLLMRIKDDTKSEISFVEGESKEKDNWEVCSGATEFADEKIIITSESESNGLVKLKKNVDLKNFYFSAVLTGNKLGEQTVFARANEDCTSYIAVKIKNNILYLAQNSKGSEKELFSLDLNELDGVEDAADIGIKEPGNRRIKFGLLENSITVWVDNKKVVENLEVLSAEGENLFLQVAWAEYGSSQRTLADDVYDGVFEQLTISADETGKEVIHTQKLNGFAKFLIDVKNIKDSIINWFIEYL